MEQISVLAEAAGKEPTRMAELEVQEEEEEGEVEPHRIRGSQLSGFSMSDLRPH